MSYDPVRWGAQEIGRQARRGRTRWFILTAMVAMLVAATVELAWPGDPDRWVSPTMVWFAFVGTVAMSSPFARSIYWFGSPGVTELDEFERDVMGRAGRMAHFTTVAILGGGCGALATAAGNGIPPPALPRQWIAIGLALFAVTITLPILFAEFMVPVPNNAEQWEDA